MQIERQPSYACTICTLHMFHLHDFVHVHMSTLHMYRHVQTTALVSHIMTHDIVQDLLYRIAVQLADLGCIIFNL